MARATRTRKSKKEALVFPDAKPIADEAHPGFQGWLVADGGTVVASQTTSGSVRSPRSPYGDPVSAPFEIAGAVPIAASASVCGPVSGRYIVQSVLAPSPPSGKSRGAGSDPQTTVTFRADVDRFYPQQRLSIEVVRHVPHSIGHAIAEVTSDNCLGTFRRRTEAQITYRDGDPGLIPGDSLVFEANGSGSFAYTSYRLTILSGEDPLRVYDLALQSPFFDDVEFEVDVVDDAGTAVTTYDTASHPNRPANLPAETISLVTTYQRAGFNASLSPNQSTIPISGAGTNRTWSDSEMHNAMVTYWSRFSDRPQWAMWVLYAALHDDGRSLGGIMFDDIGANHRQGTAIFTDSFIRDAPDNDPNPSAWRARMQFWTAIHEMGHAFNLAHAWQKSLGRPFVDGDPWIPLIDEPESRSFMNYPFRVQGGQQAFFADFDFRFSDDELLFMRHAPRRFVQMGNEDWFENHGFRQDLDASPRSQFRLEVRANRETNLFTFLEPVILELKLTNASEHSQMVDEDTLADGRHVAIVVTREGGKPRKWRPFATYCHETEIDTLKPGESLYASHFVGASTDGWLIDEPGFYKVQAAADVNEELVKSNVLRFYVSPPDSKPENEIAPDYFNEDVARVLAFNGTPALEGATDVLRTVVDRLPKAAAAMHAVVALSEPEIVDFKQLVVDGKREDMTFKTVPAKLESAAKDQIPTLVKNSDMAAETLGHIPYRHAVERLSSALADAGAQAEAAQVQGSLVNTMKRRGVLKSVVAASERKLRRLKT